jgi:WhiB family transcriptional regulator, redox-sensing transcriptional regulator
MAAEHSHAGRAHLAELIAPDVDRRWQSNAACRDVPDPDIFFPEKGKNGDDAKHAKQICAACPVAAQCLEYAFAIRQGYDYGIYGGLTAGERARLLLSRSRDGRSRRGRGSSANQQAARLRADPGQARAALDLARQVGVLRAARQLGVDPRTLYRAWDQHSLGRPPTTARQSRAGHQRRPARQRRRTRGEVDGRERD